MIIKHSDWELGAYIYEYNGAPFNNVSDTSPIVLLSETFFSNCTKSFINKKFFYFDLSKDTYFLKCDVEVIYRFYITLKTNLDNSVFLSSGYYVNPLQLKTKRMAEVYLNTTANTITNYRSSVVDGNLPKWLAFKNDSFFILTINME